MVDETSDLDRILAARELEREIVAEVDEETLAILVFELGGEAFAFEGACIKAVLPISEPFFVPGCPPELEGIILHRGEIESLIDISTIIGRAPLKRGNSRAILLGQTPTMRSGIRVDRVVDVAQLARSAIAPAPQSVRDSLRDMAARVVERKTGLVPLLDLGAIFAAWERGPR